MKSHHYGSLAVITAAVLWSLDGLLRKQLFDLPPSVIVFWEHVIGVMIILPIAFLVRSRVKRFTKQQWMSVVTVSFLSGALGTVLYTAALTRTQFSPISVVVLLQQLQPIFAIVAASLLLKEKITQKFVGLAVIALIAAYFTAFPDLKVDFEGGRDTTIAALYALGAAASWGVSTALSKYSLKGVGSLQVTATRFALVPVFALAIAWLAGDHTAIGDVNTQQVRYILAITFSTGLVALAVYYYGLKRIMASRSTLLELTWPVSALVVGFVWLDESFTSTQWAGAVVLTVVVTYIARSQIDKSE